MIVIADENLKYRTLLPWPCVTTKNWCPSSYSLVGAFSGNGMILEAFSRLCQTSKIELFAKQLTAESHWIVLQRAPSLMFDWILNRLLNFKIFLEIAWTFLKPVRFHKDYWIGNLMEIWQFIFYIIATLRLPKYWNYQRRLLYKIQRFP